MRLCSMNMNFMEVNHFLIWALCVFVSAFPDKILFVSMGMWVITGNSPKWVIWPNIVKFRVYLHYRYYSNLFREMRKKSEFWQRCCRNSTKVWERKRKSGREKILNFGNVITEIPATQMCALCSKCEVLKKETANPTERHHHLPWIEK